MNPGEAVLIHGTLPPIHLEAVRWWAQKELAALVPLDDDGHPNPPDDLPTCPLGPEAPAAENPDVDEATLVSTLAELANIGKKKSSGPRTRGGPGPGQMTLPDETTNPAPPSPSPSPASAAPSPRPADYSSSRRSVRTRPSRTPRRLAWVTLRRRRAIPSVAAHPACPAE